MSALRLVRRAAAAVLPGGGTAPTRERDGKMPARRAVFYAITRNAPIRDRESTADSARTWTRRRRLRCAR